MSEQWQGLHNPNQHKRYKDECRCVGCGDYEWCASEYPCRCCLAAEVETLRKERDALREVADDAERIVGILEAQVQRVRELHREIDGWTSGPTWCESTSDGDPTFYPCSTIRALDGGDDD